MSNCADAVTRWHLENSLLLNPSKTEALVTGSRQQVAKFDNTSTAIRFADTVVECSKTVRILGVTIDKFLTFDNHITNIVQSCNYHIRSLRHIRHLIDHETANTLACSIVASRLDYCNAVLYGVTDRNYKRLQRVQNSLARVVCNAPYRSPSLPLLKSLHWLPIEQRIEYKIATMTYKLRLHHQPSYLFELIGDYRPVRCLRSSSLALMTLPPLGGSRTQTAARAFRLASPKIWNSLPVAVRESTSLSTFCRLLKGHLFNVFE